MDLNQQIQGFHDFLQAEYYDALLEQVRHGKQFLIIDFKKLAAYNPDLAEALLDQPEEVLKAGEMGLKNFDLPLQEPEFYLRFKNLPTSQQLMIRDIRAKHLGKFLQIEGIVRQKSDVRPQVTSARFECPSCGNIIPVLQLEQKFREPARCSCGRKGKFRLLDKHLVDAQKLVLEESPEDLEGGEQPKRLNIFLKNDLVSPMTDKLTNPGARIQLTGVIKEVPITLQQGGQSVRYDLMFEANYVEPMQEDYTQIEISEEEKKEILELSKSPTVFAQLVENIAPTIYGHEKVKEALVLQLLGGVKKTRGEGGVTTRGDIHILLIGDPGAGKCVAGDTLLQLADGTIKPIEELFAEERGAFQGENAYTTKHKLNVLSLGLNGKEEAREVATLWRRRVKKALKIVLQSGESLVVTPDHPFFTPLACFITSVPAKELLPGTLVATPRKLTPATSLQILRKDDRRKDDRGTSYLTPWLGRLFGYLVGSGNIKGRSITITQNEELLADATRLFQKLGVQPKNQRAPRQSATKARTLLVTDRRFLTLIRENAPELLKRQKEQHIPAIIQRSPNAVVREFLRGLFSTTEQKSHALRYTTKSRRLAQEVRMLLLRFGIKSNIKRREAHPTTPSYEIVVSEDATRRTAMCTAMKAVERKDIRAHPSRKEEDPQTNPLRTAVEQFTNADVFWDVVEHVETLDQEMDVYDLEVATTHNFVANCAYIHNSQLLKRISYVAPKARFVSGKGASGAGLTASVVKDEFLRGWALEAGALVLANKGICCIDELDKMSQEDRSAMHEALEQQSVTISKANIQATLRAETTVLAAANPKFGRFDPYELLAKQIDLPSTLINRFDLIFPIRDLPDREKDEQLASFILKLHQEDESVKGTLDPEFLRKYISYAKRHIKPHINQEALEEIKNYYIKMRSSGGEEGSVKAIPISARQLEALVRLTEASAKARLSNVATKRDAKVAIDLVHHCLSAIGLDPETGKFDIDRITTGITATQRSKISIVKEVLAELEEVVGKVIPVEDVIREAELRGVSAEETEETLEGLKRKGDVYNPKHGFVSRM